LKALALPLLALAPASAKEVPKSQASPAAVARASFEAFKRQDIPAIVSLFHPDELKRFKAFAQDVFAYDKPDEEGRQIRQLFAPHDSAKSAASASGSELLAAFLKNSIAAMPGFNEIMGKAQLQILGEIEEKPDRVHVITRTILPRPSPVSCIRSDDRWHLLLNEETMRLVSAFQRKQHFRDKPGELLSKPMTMDKIEALGYVNDGEDAAQVLCRITMKIDDFAFPVFGCYPVRTDEPAWDHLNDKDKTKLIEALRAKWSP
jgi:hypothetical protein